MSVVDRMVKKMYHGGHLVVGASVGVHCKGCEEGEGWQEWNKDKGSTTTDPDDHVTL